jgi:hypothetical protein
MFLFCLAILEQKIKNLLEVMFNTKRIGNQHKSPIIPGSGPPYAVHDAARGSGTIGKNSVSHALPGDSDRR